MHLFPFGSRYSSVGVGFPLRLLSVVCQRQREAIDGCGFMDTTKYICLLLVTTGYIGHQNNKGKPLPSRMNLVDMVLSTTGRVQAHNSATDDIFPQEEPHLWCMSLWVSVTWHLNPIPRGDGCVFLCVVRQYACRGYAWRVERLCSVVAKGVLLLRYVASRILSRPAFFWWYAVVDSAGCTHIMQQCRAVIQT